MSKKEIKFKVIHDHRRNNCRLEFPKPVMYLPLDSENIELLIEGLEKAQEAIRAQKIRGME